MLQEMTQKILILLNFPNDSEDKVKEFADNVITIGALNFEYGDKVVARFSNIRKLNVDVLRRE
jgi:hypothetical protein